MNMAKINWTYEGAAQNYPEAAEKIIQKIQNGKSKYKDTAPQTWQWSIVWAESKFKRVAKPPDVEMRVEWRLKSCQVWLSASTNPKGKKIKELIDSQAIRGEISNQEFLRWEEEQRVSTLSEDERNEELCNAILDIEKNIPAALNSKQSAGKSHNILKDMIAAVALYSGRV